MRRYVWAVSLGPDARHPISFALAKRNGVSPKEKRLLVGVFTIPTVFSPLYLPEAVALSVKTARPPPAEGTACVDCQITDHLTFAGGERCISVCADHGQTLPAPSATRYRKDLGQALFFDGSTPFLWASTKEMGSKRQ